jgi:RNA polymerase sigma-54 factor
MQSIRLLQLSHLELNAFVEAELLRNPLLEREDGEPASESDLEPPEAPGETGAYEDTVDHGDIIQSADQIASSYDTEMDNVFPEQGAQDRLNSELGRGALGEMGEAPDIDQFVAARPTLTDYLNDQIGLLLADPAERMIAHFLSDGLNDAGYLVTEVETVATQLGAPIDRVEAVLRQLQTLDPVGVFARDVRECLALQLADRDRLDPMMSKLLDHLDLIASHDLATLGRLIGADREDLFEMLAELRRLDPKPGRAFERSPVEAVVPDVFVRERAGGWFVELNSDILPRVLVNREYYATVTRGARDAAEKSFLVDCLQTANYRETAGRVLAAWHFRVAPDDAQARSRRNRDARVDRQPRHFE